MKAYLINVLIFGGILLLYYCGIFSFFANSYAQIAIFVLVGILFVIGLFVLGNPFSGGKDDEQNKK